MNLLYYTLLAFALFFATMIAFEKKNIWGTVIGALGVGGVVNSGFFTAASYPIDIFGLSFGVDSIIYTLFVFTVILKYLYWDKKEALIFAISASAALLFAAFIELTANAFSTGHTEVAWRKFGVLALSAFATITAGVSMIYILDAIKNKWKLNQYWLLIIGLVYSTLVNSTIYFGLVTFISGTKFSFEILGTSYLGKSIAIVAAVSSFGVLKLLEKHIIKIKEKKKLLKESKETEKTES